MPEFVLVAHLDRRMRIGPVGRFLFVIANGLVAMIACYDSTFHDSPPILSSLVAGLGWLVRRLLQNGIDNANRHKKENDFVVICHIAPTLTLDILCRCILHSHGSAR